MIVAGSASQVLGARLAHETERELALVEYERFPDGEGIVRIPDEIDEATVVASTPTDAAHVELLQILEACEGGGVSRIDLVLPYMGYARQDARFEGGEPISARAVARSLPHVDSVTTVNVHEDDVLGWFDADEKSDLDAVPALAEALNVRDAVVVAPDESAYPLAESLADTLGARETDYLVKERLSGDEVCIEPSSVDAEGEDIVVVDDMVATGGTMSTAVGMLREQGARSVHATCVHPVFARNSVLRLYTAGVDSVAVTDTLPSALESVSVAPVVADHLR